MEKEIEKTFKYLAGVSPLARNHTAVINKINKCLEQLINDGCEYIKYNHNARRWVSETTGYMGRAYVLLSASTVYTDGLGEKSPVKLAEWLPTPTDASVRFADVIETVSGWAHEVLMHKDVEPKTISIDDAIRGFVRI